MSEQSARDYEPGTLFVVVEIPPECPRDVADDLTEKIMIYAAEIEPDDREGWDLFVYRQHNAPPADVPRVQP
jgi:hypothetical protein